jgi:hypothetical protein
MMVAASQMNERLARKDWTRKNCDEAAEEMLRILFFDRDDGEPDIGGGEDNGNIVNNDDATACVNNNRTTTRVQVPPGALVEMAAVGPKQRTMRRLFSSTLFGQAGGRQ